MLISQPGEIQLEHMLTTDRPRSCPWCRPCGHIQELDVPYVCNAGHLNQSDFGSDGGGAVLQVVTKRRQNFQLDKAR